MARNSHSLLSVEYVMLGLLVQHPCHGYELHKQLSDLKGIGLVWRVKQGNLYAMLEKLERKGYIQSAAPAELQQTKKEYLVTEMGRKAFDHWLRTPARKGREMRQDFLARLYFARIHGQRAVYWLVQQQEALCENWLQSLDKQLTALDEGQEYERLVYQFRKQQVQAMMNWLGSMNNGTSPEKKPVSEQQAS